jgi:hypothetical protein
MLLRLEQLENRCSRGRAKGVDQREERFPGKALRVVVEQQRAAARLSRQSRGRAKRELPGLGPGLLDRVRSSRSSSERQRTSCSSSPDCPSSRQQRVATPRASAEWIRITSGGVGPSV